MATLSVDLPVNCLNNRLFQVLDQSGALNGDWDRLRVRVPDGWSHPGVLAFLDAWGRKACEEGRRIDFEGNSTGSLRYMARMNLFEHVGFPFRENFERWNEAGRFLPLMLITDGDSVKTAVDSLCDLIVRQFDDARAFLPAVEWAVNEVVDNILVHSDTAVPGVVCAQYTKNHLLHVGICDMGRGVRRSLSESHAVATDLDAVQLAIQRGITRNRSVGQGNGLAGTHQIIGVNGGHLGLWSGSGCYVVRDGADKGAIAIPTVPGTGVSLSMRTQHPVDLDQTFIATQFWTYLDAECQRLAESGGMIVRNECLHAGSRDMALPIRRKVEALLPDLGDDRLVLNFEGMGSPSSSFLDELLAKLIVHVGEHEFQRRVEVVGMSERVADMANVVIGQRLGHVPEGVVPTRVHEVPASEWDDLPF